MERLNKYLAACGVSSRRGADKLIAEGVVKVNGKVVKEMGEQVNPNNDTVMVDGIIVKPVTEFSYVIFYKPKGCITTTVDELGRKTIFDYIDLDIPHLLPVGRLDYDTEGMLLLTNDGDLAYSLTHPSHEVSKTYLVKFEGDIVEHQLAQLRKGVILDGEQTNRCKVKVLEYVDNITKLTITITEGRNRQVRRMLEAIGKEVIFLKRVAIGDLKLGGLPRGGNRFLTEREVDYLKSL